MIFFFFFFEPAGPGLVFFVEKAEVEAGFFEALKERFMTKLH